MNENISIMDFDPFPFYDEAVSKIIDGGLEKLTDKELCVLEGLATEELDKLVDEEVEKFITYEHAYDKGGHEEYICDQPNHLDQEEIFALISEKIQNSDGVISKIDDEMLRELIISSLAEIKDKESSNFSDKGLNNTVEENFTSDSVRYPDELDDEVSSNVSSQDLDDFDNEEFVHSSEEQSDHLEYEGSHRLPDGHSDSFDDEGLYECRQKGHRRLDYKKLWDSIGSEHRSRRSRAFGNEAGFNNIKAEIKAGLEFLKFNIDQIEQPGIKVQHSEEGFIKALLRELVRLIFLATEVLADYSLLSQDRPLPRGAGIIAQNFYEALKHCSRLKSSPELFSSPSLRSKFLQTLGKILPVIIMLVKALDLATYNLDLFQKAPESGGSNEHKIPHPNLADGKNPWNKWLNNGAEENPGKIGIQQRIPRMGHAIMRRVSLEYDAIEEDFTKNGFIVRDPDDESSDLYPPGQEYHHLSEADFATIPTYLPGYSSRDVVFIDEEDMLTLEHLNGWGLHGDGPEDQDMVYGEENFPYFKFELVGEAEHEAILEML